MNKVDFYVDDSLKHTATSTPYTWTWDEKAFGKKTIKVSAYDNIGNGVYINIEVLILNIQNLTSF